jgi:hypothetical protein
MGGMRALYDARVGDLAAGDLILIECRCAHDAAIHPAALPALGLLPDQRIIDLASRLRCRGCNQRGEAVV